MMTTAENRHPADSTYHCKTEIALPAGADSGDIWETASDVTFRVVSTPSYGVTDHQLVIWADGIQSLDGSLSEAAARIDIDWSRNPLNSDQCRELAIQLLELAAVLDAWTGEVTPAAALGVAYEALDSAERTLRSQRGTAGCWVRAALDAVAEARALLR